MVLKGIANGMTTIRLSPDECKLLSQACDAAADDLTSGTDETRQSQIETFGAAFKAMAIAGIAQGEMQVGDLELLQRELLAQGLAA